MCEVLPHLIDFLAAHPSRIAQILTGAESAFWTARDIRALETVVLSRTSTAREASDYLRVLRKACAYWVMRERLSLALPRIPVFSPEPLHPLRGNLARQLERYRGWKQLLEHWLRNSHTSFGNRDDGGPLLEMLIVSAVIFGGLHSLSSLLAMIRAIPESERRTQWENARMHIELDISWRGISGREMRRWQPDSVSAALWARLHCEPMENMRFTDMPSGNIIQLEDRALVRRVTEGLRAFVLRDSLPNQVGSGDLYGLLRAARAAAASEIPAILAAYASRKFLSNSVSQGAWKRIVEPASRGIEPITPRKSEPFVMHKSSTRNPGTMAGSDDSPEGVDPLWLKELRAVFRIEKRSDIRQRLQELSNRFDPPIARRMADFSASLLIVRTASGKVRSLRAVRLLAIDVARNLAIFAGLEDPAELHTEALETLYTQCMESIGSATTGDALPDQRPGRLKRRQRLAYALWEFHRYLIAREGKQPLEHSAEFDHIAECTAVDANPITLEDYTRALAQTAVFWSQRRDIPQRRIARLLLILGFRCGLRRLEALHLRIEDIRPGPRAEIWIRPNAMRRLKSRNAVRRIPIFALMDDTEVKELMCWREERMNQIAPHSEGYLFCAPHHALDPMPQTILEDVNKILQHATGDPSMHYHQLRHSFASWTWLRLMLADMDPLPDLFPELSLTKAWLAESSALRDNLYSHVGPTRKHTYFVAQLLGHGNPATSMEHYIHFADRLLAAYLARSPIMQPGREHILLASNRPRSTAQRWLEQGGPMAAAGKLWHKQTQILPEKSAHSTTIPTSRPEIKWVQQVVQALLADDKSRDRMEMLPDFLSRNQPLAQLFERAKYLAHIPSGNRTMRHRTELDPTPSYQTATVACPLQPIHRMDWQVVDHFQARMASLWSENPQLVQAALDSYIHRVWRTRSLVVWHDPLEAGETRKFFDFLLQLGLQRQDIQWVAFDDAVRSRPLADWKRELHLSHYDRIVKEKTPNRKASTTERWLAIEPMLHRFCDSATQANPGAYGFRFLLLIGFIAFGQFPAITPLSSRIEK